MSMSSTMHPQRRTVFVIAEQTPNPDSMMFYPQAQSVLGDGTKSKTYNKDEWYVVEEKKTGEDGKAMAVKGGMDGLMKAKNESLL